MYINRDGTIGWNRTYSEPLTNLLSVNSIIELPDGRIMVFGYIKKTPMINSECLGRVAIL